MSDRPGSAGMPGQSCLGFSMFSFIDGWRGILGLESHPSRPHVKRASMFWFHGCLALWDLCQLGNLSTPNRERLHQSSNCVQWKDMERCLPRPSVISIKHTTTTWIVVMSVWSSSQIQCTTHAARLCAFPANDSGFPPRQRSNAVIRDVVPHDRESALPVYTTVAACTRAGSSQ